MEVELRRARHALYLRLATAHAGPLGPALLGHPELASRYAEAYATCGGAEGLPCQGVGGEPRVCVVRRLEHLAYSALRGVKGGGSRRGLWWKGFFAASPTWSGRFPRSSCRSSRPPRHIWRKT
ncbi:hypothetical protein [Thermus brockianus]|uniref:Uncharacterized protein n=1 Tax=Thermus brockianus TaxID=56956 RepID=A0A1J0LSB4_THEBO|nr:hypothetical protein [Thermus brockianus]APD09206.1 hypothetical protein A0O31_01056 [Thermus brockianus]